MRTFTAYLMYDPEVKVYVGVIPTISGAHTQGETLDELHRNLQEVLELCLEEEKDDGSLDELPRFVGTLQIDVT